MPQQTWWVFQLYCVISFISKLWSNSNINSLIFLFHSLCFSWTVFLHLFHDMCLSNGLPHCLIYPLADEHFWFVYCSMNYFLDFKLLPRNKTCCLKIPFSSSSVVTWKHWICQFQARLLNISIFLYLVFWCRKITFFFHPSLNYLLCWIVEIVCAVIWMQVSQLIKSIFHYTMLYSNFVKYKAKWDWMEQLDNFCKN